MFFEKGVAGIDLEKMLLQKCPAGSSLQIFFEDSGFYLILKIERNNQFPGSVFRSMG
jgi:hypothetical protein